MKFMTCFIRSNIDINKVSPLMVAALINFYDVGYYRACIQKFESFSWEKRRAFDQKRISIVLVTPFFC